MIMAPTIATRIAINVLSLIISCKNSLANKAVKNGVIDSRNKVLATEVFRTEITDPIKANIRPIPPKKSLREEPTITFQKSDLCRISKNNVIRMNKLTQRYKRICQVLAD